ncbi:hypothetical protein QN277_019876 [Acacia crassicarpa]|uniref:F-box domain-containing protein n=1 Tax=Acacia crassicarpa TaxID=499986 RepID=A0AAE1JNB9_9FABA|nr:hypothetical protein QN277_019876 [Acacia crassicarpa]
MMKKKEVEADDSLLPQEIIRDILTRLPVKSLIRFQCVCRHWRDLFKDPSFIADHLHNSNHQNPYILCQLTPWHDYRWNMHFLGSDMQVWRFQMPPLIEHLNRGKIVGSSNGLLCVKTYRLQHSFLLWNPAIKEVKLVPEIDFCRKFYRRGTYSIGFGFCPSLNDYKIVITFVKNDYFEMFKVYSLRSNSWKEVKYGLDACKIYYRVTVNGVMFWLGKKSSKDHYFEVVIFSFDLATEMWTVIPEPEQHSSTVYHNLMVYEGKLAFVICTDDFKHSAIHLLVKEEGVGASRETWNWTKIFSSNPYPSNGLLPETMWGNEILCRRWDGESTITVLFNPTTEKFKKLNICNIGDVQKIFNYVESLVSVGGMKSLTKVLKRQGGSSGHGSSSRVPRMI